ncbi:MAG: class I SAM-dependent methyltransferase [Candidatus Hermodarchaeota archaeon]
MNIDEWLNEKAESILKEIGIKPGIKVLDFGCGSGTYSTIISNIVGNRGKIYALDYDEDKLEELNSKIKINNTKNIEIFKTSKQVSFPIQDNYLDVILIYDVWHLLSDNERKDFLKESKRTLKKGGFVSYLATHLHDPNVNLEEINNLMKEKGLILLEKFYKPMFHWSWIEEYQIFNYYKK